MTHNLSKLIFFTLIIYSEAQASMTRALLGAGGACFSINTSWAPQSGSLVGAWALDGTVGAIASGATVPATVGGASLNGTTSAAGLSYATGRVNQVVTFNSSEVITIPNTTTLDTATKMSFSFWAKPTLLDGTARGEVCKRANSGINGGSYCFFFYTSGNLAVDIGGSQDRFLVTGFSANTWHHIVVVYDGSLAAGQRTKVYVQGVLRATSSSSLTAIPTNVSNLLIGGMTANLSANGQIDEVAIWKAALTPAEVKTIYDQQSCGAN